jgi:3-oxoacyl-[acyl-carrier protein] reductase
MSKTFLFAGASSAIAKETAIMLKENGDRVIGISTRDPEGFYDELYKVEKYDFGVFPALEQPIDGLVYFPGTINLKPFARLTPAEFSNDFQVNTFGAAAFVQAYLNNLKKSKSAAIVFLSSVAANIGLPFHSSIAMAKGGLQGLSNALAAELAPSIRVNAVALSLINTPLSVKFTDTPLKLEQMQKRNPMRQVGEARDAANAIAFLLSDKAAWVSGQVFAIDGGMATLKN